MDPALTSRLEEIYRIVRNAFIRYIVENAETEMRGDFDRRVFAAFDAWERENQRAHGHPSDRAAPDEDGRVS